MATRQHIMRVYVDTSVFGGAFDDEFSSESTRFFHLIRKRHLALVTSSIVQDEILRAPVAVQSLFDEFLPVADICTVDEYVVRLMRGYLDAGIVSPKWQDDALHVALATIADCHMIVSWNFRHIVHYQKIPRYNAINTLQGYREIAIHSPLEVIADEEDI